MPSSVHPSSAGCGCDPNCIRCFSSPLMSLRERFRLRNVAAAHVLAERTNAFHPVDIRDKIADMRKSLYIQIKSPLACLAQRSNALLPNQMADISMLIHRRSASSQAPALLNPLGFGSTGTMRSLSEPLISNGCSRDNGKFQFSIQSHSLRGWLGRESRSIDAEFRERREKSSQSSLLEKLVVLRINSVSDNTSYTMPTPTIAPPPCNEGTHKDTSREDVGWAKWEDLVTSSG